MAKNKTQTETQTETKTQGEDKQTRNRYGQADIVSHVCELIATGKTVCTTYKNPKTGETEKDGLQVEVVCPETGIDEKTVKWVQTLLFPNASETVFDKVFRQVFKSLKGAGLDDETATRQAEKVAAEAEKQGVKVSS